MQLVAGLGRVLGSVSMSVSLRNLCVNKWNNYRVIRSCHQGGGESNGKGMSSQMRSKDYENIEGVVREVKGNEVNMYFRKLKCTFKRDNSDIAKYGKGDKIKFSKLILTVDQIQKTNELPGTKGRGQLGSWDFVEHFKPSSYSIKVLGYVLLVFASIKYFPIALLVALDLLLFAIIFF